MDHLQQLSFAILLRESCCSMAPKMRGDHQLAAKCLAVELLLIFAIAFQPAGCLSPGCEVTAVGRDLII
jgi:hypothetical protein